MLRIHVDDDADFHGAAKHDIHDDDFENEDAKFAANILHKQAAAEEEEEVYEGLEAGDEDMAWVPPSVHRVRRVVLEEHPSVAAAGLTQPRAACCDHHRPKFTARSGYSSGAWRLFGTRNCRSWA